MDIPHSRTLPDLLDEMAARHPDREAVVWGKQRLTYRDYRARARQLAKGLLALGVERGDKVALLMENRTEWLLADFAVTLLGATLVPVSTWSTARELAYVLRHSDATTLITVDRFRDRDFLALLAEAGAAPSPARAAPAGAGLRHVICLGAERYPGLTAFADLGARGAGVSDADLGARQRAVEPRDVAYILYTSGTTSTPKGVPLQHFGLIENMFNIGERQHLTEGGPPLARRVALLGLRLRERAAASTTARRTSRSRSGSTPSGAAGTSARSAPGPPSARPPRCRW